MPRSVLKLYPRSELPYNSRRISLPIYVNSNILFTGTSIRGHTLRYLKRRVLYIEGKDPQISLKIIGRILIEDLMWLGKFVVVYVLLISNISLRKTKSLQKKEDIQQNMPLRTSVL